MAERYSEGCRRSGDCYSVFFSRFEERAQERTTTTLVDGVVAAARTMSLAARTLDFDSKERPTASNGLEH